jgi:hypothetical protein
MLPPVLETHDMSGGEGEGIPTAHDPVPMVPITPMDFPHGGEIESGAGKVH